MIVAAIPPDEAERLADLRALNILDTPPEQRFDRIVRIAARVFGVPISYVAMVDSDRQWFKSKCGLTSDETGRDISFCSHAILQTEPLIVPDATKDLRFHDNPLVVNEPHVRFYAGYPLAGPGGRAVGTFCIADRRPRTLSRRQLDTLAELAAMVEHELGMVDLIRTQHNLIRTQQALARTQQKLTEELNDAAEYVRSLLPPKLNGDGPIRTDWEFISSSQLGGDFFGYHWLSRRRLALYALDVCGHGVAASLLSISVHNALRRETLPNTRFDEPSEVLAGLNRAFPMEENNNKFFTIWYGVFDVPSRTLRYATGGHPPAVLLDGPESAPRQLGGPGFVIGMLSDATFETLTETIPLGSRLYLYSDGAYEIPVGPNRMFTVNELAGLIARAGGVSPARVPRIVDELAGIQGSREFSDDFSLIEVEFAGAH
jgi:sigma-B regulation protein RsbU (phosphoserine phosphatase)